MSINWRGAISIALQFYCNCRKIIKISDLNIPLRRIWIVVLLGCGHEAL